MSSRFERFRHRLHEIIFEADTWAGRAFDVALLVLIGLSVVTVILESVPSFHHRYGLLFLRAEWFFTLIFSIEYVLRLLAVRRPLRYVFSFFGLVDLMALLPTYVSLFAVGGYELLAVRILRLMRVFRILKLGEYTSAAELLMYSLRESRAKIIVFFLFLLGLVITLGSLMYVIEGRTNGFESIPLSIYWAVITVTTVGYGDIVPSTALGKIIATLIMILGYAIIAVPTGIVTVSIARAAQRGVSTQACPNCSRQGHDPDARFCKYCGEKL
ncbi:ion transporter [Tellurirhabdus rosea]|uniref:ion transporter n=1 Tax=Tellurirhabdus rosea TaxID=2674997 RepID=UPI00224D5E78|nr:ion transporter [Tellurirhabdus rosea]